MRFPRFRIFTWVILVINAIFLIWIIGGISTPTNPTDTAANVGVAIGVGLIIGLWVAADVILGVLWLITKPKTRDCPACGRAVKRGQTQCGHCGYDFAQSTRFAHDEQDPAAMPEARLRGHDTRPRHQ
ncbi:zinc ribbon domain-containing protein [Saccharopolyspora tripterygii]